VLHGCEEGGEHESPGVRLETDVVQRDVKRALRVGQESGDPPCDLGGSLATVRERLKLDRPGRPRRIGQEALRSAVLCARFSAW
jgi:hypothetical protein